MIPCAWCRSYRDVHPVRVDGVLAWFVCGRCFDYWTSTGERPGRKHIPAAGPNTGLILSPTVIREALGSR